MKEDQIARMAELRTWLADDVVQEDFTFDLIEHYSKAQKWLYMKSPSFEFEEFREIFGLDREHFDKLHESGLFVAEVVEMIDQVFLRATRKTDV